MAVKKFGLKQNDYEKEYVFEFVGHYDGSNFELWFAVV